MLLLAEVVVDLRTPLMVVLEVGPRVQRPEILTGSLAAMVEHRAREVPEGQARILARLVLSALAAQVVAPMEEEVVEAITVGGAVL